MAVVSSRIVADDVQADKRRYIREAHTLDTGDIYPVGPMLVGANYDADAAMLARVPQIEAQLTEAAIEEKRAADADSADARLDAYVAGLSDDDAKRVIGYTDDELATVREVWA